MANQPETNPDAWRANLLEDIYDTAMHDPGFEFGGEFGNALAGMAIGSMLLVDRETAVGMMLDRADISLERAQDGQNSTLDAALSATYQALLFSRDLDLVEPLARLWHDRAGRAEAGERRGSLFIGDPEDDLKLFRKEYIMAGLVEAHDKEFDYTYRTDEITPSEWGWGKYAQYLEHVLDFMVSNPEVSEQRDAYHFAAKAYDQIAGMNPEGAVTELTRQFEEILAKLALDNKVDDVVGAWAAADLLATAPNDKLYKKWSRIFRRRLRTSEIFAGGMYDPDVVDAAERLGDMSLRRTMDNMLSMLAQQPIIDPAARHY